MSANHDRPVPASRKSAAQSCFRVELSLSVTDAGALWSAAFARGLAAPGSDRDDLIEVIGPAEDPDLAACLSMLAAPAEMPGCELHDFELVELRAPASLPAANDLVARKRAGASA